MSLSARIPANSLRRGTSIALGHVPLSAQASVLVDGLNHEKRDIVMVCATESDMQQLARMIAFFAPATAILEFPAWDTLPYDRVSPSSSVVATRIATLAALTQKSVAPRIILTSIAAASQKIVPPEALQNAVFSIRTGGTLARSAFQEFLTRYGYQRTATVMEAGEYAIRGSIMDIFPSGAECAYRIDCFGDEIESIRQFDPLTQRSEQAVEAITLHAMREITLDTESISRFRTAYREAFGAVTRDDPLYEAISAGRASAGMEHWLPLFYEKLTTLDAYVPDAIWALDYRAEQVLAERHEAVMDYYQARTTYLKNKSDTPHYHPIKPETLYLDAAAWEALRQRCAVLELHAFDTAHNLPLKAHISLARAGDTPQAMLSLKALLERGEQHIILACNSAGSMERLRHLCSEHGIISEPIEKFSQLEKREKAVLQCATLPIDHGYQAPDYVLLSESDMLGERVIRTQRKKRKSDTFFQEAASFTEGELVVHREHGIGRFEGLVTVEVNNTRHDCLKLIYDGGDKLFLPVENIELISRYGHAEGLVALDKLGGVSWQKRKSALRKKLKMAAEQLLKVAAERATKPATILQADAGHYDEFCARFPYTETEDQLSAIEDVRTDLASGRATDRLICGDVGFGKTEVALRAAFVAVAAGQQVAVVVPTTLLARQHFATFAQRFRDMPVIIRQLSRMVSAKDAAATRTALAEGKVDIVIGTHAILAESVKFARLGLVIIDEEQHFGVKQKEKLKEFKADVHVLTLSATPIPRTLQMSLSGVRELSLITTPPIDRLAIRSVVMPYDPVMIREAILRERHRGGKTFYVTPRIKYMAELREKLGTLVPEITIGVAHGGMPPTELDRVMNEMVDGKYDLLLSTAIIESGIDMPTVNTIVIDRPEMFGLSQLYQLRGRVGRSNTRAYAYFTLPHHKTLTPQATKRLEVMQKLDHLGAGFSLASHDMDIRGFGNILGEEQSGHIKEVGLELYQAMLEEAVEDLKARKLKQGAREESHEWSPQINLGLSLLIPEHYVSDLPLRLSLYRRIGQLENAEMIHDMEAEMHDRFGPLPEETRYLLSVMRLKLLCKQAGIERLDMGEKGAIISFRHQKFEAAEKLLALIASQPMRYKIRADQKLGIQQTGLDSAEAKLAAAMAMASEMVSLLSG